MPTKEEVTKQLREKFKNENLEVKEVVLDGKDLLDSIGKVIEFTREQFSTKEKIAEGSDDPVKVYIALQSAALLLRDTMGIKIVGMNGPNHLSGHDRNSDSKKSIGFQLPGKVGNA